MVQIVCDTGESQSPSRALSELIEQVQRDSYSPNYTTIIERVFKSV